MAKNKGTAPSDPAKAETAAADDVTPVTGFGPDEPAEPQPPVTTPPADADRVSALERQLAELKAMLSTAAPPGTLAPPGYKLVPDVTSQDARSIAEQEHIKAEIDKGTKRRTQEHADRLFPEGKHVYRCVLAADKNGHPELLIRAANETDAVGRYLAACGVNHTEHKVQVERA
jgi:hypothetical protein